MGNLYSHVDDTERRLVKNMISAGMIPIVCNSTRSDDQDGNDTVFLIAPWPLMLAWPSVSTAQEVPSTGAT